MLTLITGGGGFLGAWVIRRLSSSGGKVRVLDVHRDRRRLAEIAGAEVAREVEWHVGDIAEFETVLEALSGCDSVIHLAGLLTPACRRDPLRGARTNVIGTLNVFEAARAREIRRVAYTSSGGVFGPKDEAHPFPWTHYGAFKLANEGNARAYWLDSHIASVGIRPFVVYGPGREDGLTAGITLACRAAATGESYTIPLSGEAALVFVDDVAAAFEAAVTALIEGAHTLNLTGTVATMEDVIASIRRTVPAARIGYEGPPLPSSPRARNEFANGLLPLGQERDLDEGIAETIDFYRTHAK